jgi:hypothetical protein
MRLASHRRQALLHPVTLFGDHDHRDRADLRARESEPAAKGGEKTHADRPRHPSQGPPPHLTQT